MRLLRRTLFILFLSGLIPATLAGPDDKVKETSKADPLFSVQPALRFVTPDTAEIFWESEMTGKATLVYGDSPRLGKTVTVEHGDGRHRARLTGLAPGTVYFYKIGHQSVEDGKMRYSDTYECNTSLSFALPEIGTSNLSNKAEEKRAQSILTKSGVTKGYAVMVGTRNVKLAAAVVRMSDLIVILAEKDTAQVESDRRRLFENGVHGSRVHVVEISEDGRVPLTSCVANLVIAGDRSLDDTEVKRLMTPGDGRALRLDNPEHIVTRPPLKGTGEWTHQYGDAGNTAASEEALGGAASTPELVLQWLGRPGADFGIDRNPRMPAPLSAGGRLYHQGMSRMVGLDARNGAVYWALEIPALRRVNIPRDCGNWCADRDRLYVIVKDRAWVLDGATGERRQALPVLPSESAADGAEWGYIGVHQNVLMGSAVRSQANYTRFWSGKMWYDGKGGEEGTEKVCSDSIFGYTVGESGADPTWMWSKGAIINSTISVCENRVHFVECRNTAILKDPKRRLKGTDFWADQFLVALDTQSGKLLWERPLDTEDGTVSFYMQCAPGTLLITASNTAYHLYAFDPKTGEPIWNRSNSWYDNHHSGHLQHPVIAGNTIYLQPNGYDLRTGEVTTSKLGIREGCHTYVGAGEALIYRGESRQIAMWDRKEETVSSWPRLRPSCWLSTIPASGMLLLPEAGGGCSCGGWMETSIGFLPQKHLD